MTTHYIDIALLPDPEFSQAHLLGALVAKLHRALVELGETGIGVSFPQYSLRPRSLGALLRLHGSEAGLQRLMALPWLKGMRDHVQCSAPLPAPTAAAQYFVRRRQFKTSAERLRRRRMLRKGESAEQAAAAIPDGMERTPDLPYVQLRSTSTGQAFCLFIDQTLAQGAAGSEGFNAYGLSLGTSTVPWF